MSNAAIGLTQLRVTLESELLRGSPPDCHLQSTSMLSTLSSRLMKVLAPGIKATSTALSLRQLGNTSPRPTKPRNA